MSDAPARTEARPVKSRWPGVIWAIPIAALLIVGYLGVRAYAQAGVDVVVTFKSAADARPGDTQVVYQGLSIGRVTKVELNKDGRRVDMTLRLNPKTKPELRTGTEFWVIGNKPSLTDLASLKAAVAGVAIGMAPGPGAPARRFVGLEEAPVVPRGTPGQHFVLTSDAAGALRPGSSIFYHGLDAGKVTGVKLEGPQTFRVDVFVQAPFDGLVRPDSLFFNASAVQISLSGGGLSTQFAPGAAALGGGVEFDTPKDVYASEPPSRSGDHFVLYTDRSHAAAGPLGPQILYDVAFTDGVGDLDVGAPVKLRGFQIGSVVSRSLKFDPETGVLSTPATIEIEPVKLNLQGVKPPADGDWRTISNAALTRLVAQGYRVRMAQTPPLIGGKLLSLDRVPGAPLARIRYGGPNPELPTAAAGDVNSITAKVDDILTKVDRIPITAIGQDVRRLTSRLQSLANSPKVSDSLTHLDSTLAQLDQTVAEVRPQIGPLVTKLNHVADGAEKTVNAANQVLSGQGAGQDASLPAAVRELTDAARTIRSLADYLSRHPEAIIKGKAVEKR